MYDVGSGGLKIADINTMEVTTLVDDDVAYNVFITF